MLQLGAFLGCFLCRPSLCRATVVGTWSRLYSFRVHGLARRIPKLLLLLRRRRRGVATCWHRRWRATASLLRLLLL